MWTSDVSIRTEDEAGDAHEQDASGKRKKQRGKGKVIQKRPCQKEVMEQGGSPDSLVFCGSFRKFPSLSYEVTKVVVLYDLLFTLGRCNRHNHCMVPKQPCKRCIKSLSSHCCRYSLRRCRVAADLASASGFLFLLLYSFKICGEIE